MSRLEATEQLAYRAVRGERDAFSALYQRLGVDVVRFLVGLRLRLDHQQLEDAVQETFLRLYRQLSGYDPSRPLKPFLLGIARHVALELCRREDRLPLPAPPRADVFPDPLTRILASERQGLVLACLGSLHVEHRVALVLRVLNGVTMVELAEALGCSVPTARARLQAAGRALSVALRRKGIGPVVTTERSS